MRTFIEDITGAEVPKRKSPGQAKFMAPLRFTEGEVKALAERKKWR